MGMFSNLILGSYPCITFGLHIQSTYDHHVWKGKKIKTIIVQLLVEMPSRLPIIILKNFFFLKSINEKSLKVIRERCFSRSQSNCQDTTESLSQVKNCSLKKGNHLNPEHKWTADQENPCFCRRNIFKLDWHKLKITWRKVNHTGSTSFGQMTKVLSRRP